NGLRTGPSAPEPAKRRRENDDAGEKDQKRHRGNNHVLRPEDLSQDHEPPFKEVQEQQRIAFYPDERSKKHHGQQQPTQPRPGPIETAAWLPWIQPLPAAFLVGSAQVVAKIAPVHRLRHRGIAGISRSNCVLTRRHGQTCPLLKCVWRGRLLLLVFGRLRVGRMSSTQGVDVAGHLVDLLRFQVIFPRDHSLLRGAVPDGGDVVRKIRTMDPVVVTEVGPDESAAIRAMTRRAQPCESLASGADHNRVTGGLEFGNAALELAHGRGLERVANLHLVGILGGRRTANLEDVIVKQIDHREEDAAVEEPHPPAWQFVVEFPDAVVVMIQQQWIARFGRFVHNSWFPGEVLDCVCEAGSSSRGSSCMDFKYGCLRNTTQINMPVKNAKKMQMEITP